MGKHSRKKKASTSPVRLRLVDKVWLLGVPVLVLVIPSLFLHFSAIHRQTASISRTVERWKTTYHINDEQAERIIQIELEFHGNGSVFSIRPQHDKEDGFRHHEEISRLMSTEDSVRFMQAMEKETERH